MVDSEDGVTVADIAGTTQTHPNTAREHLEALVRAGLVERGARPAHGRGRPPTVYRAIPTAREVGPEYRVLTEVLVELLIDKVPDEEARRALAVEAGRRWVDRRDPADRRAELVSVLRDPDPDHVLGPGCGAEDDDALGPGCQPVTLRLRECPVLELARSNPEVVCSVHLGLLQGVFSDRPCACRISLSPFAEPGACVVTIPASAPIPDDARALLTGWELDA